MSGAEGSTLSPWVRLLLWDFERGSVAYDLFCLLMLLFLILVAPERLGDPMVVHP